MVFKLVYFLEREWRRHLFMIIAEGQWSIMQKVKLADRHKNRLACRCVQESSTCFDSIICAKEMFTCM